MIENFRGMLTLKAVDAIEVVSIKKVRRLTFLGCLGKQLFKLGLKHAKESSAREQ